VPLAFVATEEGKIAARAALAAATESLDIESMDKAIVDGEARGLSSAELKPARDALTLEKKRVASRATLQQVLQEPPRGQHRDLRKLRDAIREGKAAKLLAEELEHVKQVLADEEAKAAARTCLSDAVELRDIPHLRTAIETAATAGLEDFDLEEAGSVLSSLLADRSKSYLDKAMSSRAVDDLQFAIRSCEAAGVEPSELEDSQRVLAFEHLQRAIRSRAVHDLEAAIKFAEVWQPHSRDIHVARDILQTELRKVAARSALKQAELKRANADGRMLEELLAAIREGQRAGLEDWEMGFARKALIESRQLVA